jgi:hypothetical protein
MENDLLLKDNLPYLSSKEKVLHRNNPYSVVNLFLRQYTEQTLMMKRFKEGLNIIVCIRVLSRNLHSDCQICLMENDWVDNNRFITSLSSNEIDLIHGTITYKGYKTRVIR